MSATDQSMVSAPVPPSAERVGLGRTFAGLGLSVLSAIMIVISFPDRGGLYPLLLVAFVPMYVAQYRFMPRRWSAIPILIATSAYWFVIWLVAWDLLSSGRWILAGVGIFFGASCAIFAIFDRKFSERTKYRWFIVQLPLWWVVVDSIFQENLYDGTNGWLAYRFAEATPFIQTVSVVSTPVLTFLILVFNAAIALLVIKWIDGKRPEWSTVHIPSPVIKWSSIAAFGAALVWIVTSLLIYSSLNNALASQPTVRVAAIQPGTANMPVTLFAAGASPATPAQEIARKAKQREQLSAMTRQAVSQGADLSVWPEETLNYDPRGAQGKWVGELAKETNSTIVTGFLGETPVAWPNRAAPNMAAVFGPNGDLLGVTYKVHPVLAAGEAWGGTTPEIYPTFTTPFGQLGVIVCFDHDFPNGSARLETLVGADIIANPAWDWGSISSVRWQSVVFRSIENRVPIVKGETGFDAVITNANGQVMERSDVSDPASGETAILVQDVQLGPRGAPFTAIGGLWFSAVVVIGAAIRYVWQFVLWRRSRRESASDSEPAESLPAD